MNSQRDRRSLLLVIAAVTVAACAGDTAEIRDHDSRNMTPRCAYGETLTCTEKMGKAVNCACRGRAELRKIFEPGTN